MKISRPVVNVESPTGGVQKRYAKKWCNIHFAYFLLAQADRNIGLQPVRLGRFQTRCLTRHSGVQVRWAHTDLEVDVPRLAHNSVQNFNSFPVTSHAQVDLVLTFVPNCKLANANRR